ncbi:hypothetical protein C8A01DRAFT_48067 [Parachaetomium inaequale]|uniref:Uncharacterized protein n=1 Tax=Parachaetomium inaequale TaxID=2588326 RepID=A0AAN6PCY1_9PEZI|nr:hypothetical protein C8A01DRAFT_48067 [Parachaetomium inaequale]
MWPTTANSKISQNVGPSSPPETPRTASPVFGRKSSPRPGERPPQIPLRPMAPPLSTSRAAVNGLDFSPSSAIRPEQLSPRSTSSSSASASESGDSEDSEGSEGSTNAAGPSPSAAAERRPAPTPPASQARIGRIVTQTEFIVEELSDFVGDSDEERPGVVRPCAIEYAESDGSRSASRTRPEVDQKMVFNLGNLNCSDDSDETDLDEHEYQEFLIKRRAARRHKRMTSGSIGKRTISESIGSDTDREDLRSLLGAEEAGSSARRLRRRVGDRRSLQFQDPPPPRIDELDEPDSSEDDIFVGESLARELPYYEYVSMEVDSP